MRVFLLFLILFLKNVILNAQYCPTAVAPFTTGIPSSTNEDEIGLFQIVGTTLNQSSTCAGTSLGNSIVNRYSDYTSIPHIVNFGTHVVNLLRINDCNIPHPSTAGAVVFIDYNQNFVFDPDERVLIFPNTIDQGGSISGIITIPNTAKVGATRLRVMLGENMNGATQNPCNNFTWGETEDYTIFIGQKTFDYTITGIAAPDTFGFCGQNPQNFSINVRNVGNQDMQGGTVTVKLKGVALGTVTRSKTFQNALVKDQMITVDLDNPFIFPAEEFVDVEAVIRNPIDTFFRNDTFRERIYVYKNPKVTLKYDSFCVGETTKVWLVNENKVIRGNDTILLPLTRVLWENQSEKDTILMTASQPIFANVSVSRGPCSTTARVQLVPDSLPKFVMPRDTALCQGQDVILAPVIPSLGLYDFSWDFPETLVDIYKNKVTGASSSEYKFTLTDTTTGCKTTKTTKVKQVTVPNYAIFNDSVCAKNSGNIGFELVQGFSYEWKNLNSSKNTVIIPTTETMIGKNLYTADIRYQGCRKTDTANVTVLELPKGALSLTSNSICEGKNTTLSIIGISNNDLFKWYDFNSTLKSISVSPLKTTTYKADVINTFGCVNTIETQLIINPKPVLKVYSNRFNDILCMGDDAILYANGAKTVRWFDLTGPEAMDTVRYISDTIKSSKLFVLEAISDKGCKDTFQYRLNLKPSNFDASVSILPTPKVCKGENVQFDAVIKGATSNAGYTFNWGGLDDNGSALSKNTPAIKSTKYTVTITNSDNCQKVFNADVEVIEPPVVTAQGAIVCEGSQANVSVSGSTNQYTYQWSNSGGNSNKASFRPAGNTTYTVTVSDLLSSSANCATVVNVPVTVVPTSGVAEIRSIQKTEYICPTVPITLVAVPVGGIFEGFGVEGNKLAIETFANGTYSVKYTFIEPINGCKQEDIKSFSVIKCTSGIDDIQQNKNSLVVYPNPFTDLFQVKWEALKRQNVSMRLVDLLGKVVLQETKVLNPGTHILDFNPTNIASGSYIFEFTIDGAYTHQVKIMKK
jgi:hypothetical protein